MTYENKDRFWYALGNDGNMYCLGDCGDFEVAEEIAEDTIDCGVVWIADKNTANQWLNVLGE